MSSSTANEYAKTLRKLNITASTVGQAGDIFHAVPEILADLENPAVELTAKHRVIEKVFPVEICRKMG